MKLSAKNPWVNVVYGLTAGLGLFAVVGGDCSDLPDAPVEDRQIATIRFVERATVLAVGEAADFVVDVRNREGLPITNPEVSWSSTNNGVAAVTGASTTGEVCGRGDGTTTIRASNRGGNIRAETSLRVLACTRGPCPQDC